MSTAISHAVPTALLAQLGLTDHERVVLEPVGDETPETGVVLSDNPATGRPIAGVRLDTEASYEQVLSEAIAGFDRWRRVPAPVPRSEPGPSAAPAEGVAEAQEDEAGPGDALAAPLRSHPRLAS